MIYARQSTAIIVTVGPTLDADGVAVTGGVVGDFKISKNGGAPAALNASATYTHRHTGYGSLSLTASDVDTVGTVEIVMDDTVNACPVKEIQVVETAIYDALFADTANAFTGAAGSTKVTGVALVDTLTTYTGNTPQTGDTYALANGSAGFVAIDTVVDAIKVKTDFLPSATAGAAGGVFIAGTNAATTVTTSFTTTFTGNLTGSVGSVTGAVGSVTGAVGSVTGNVGGNVTGSVGSIASGGIVAASFAAGAIDAAAIATGAIDADALAADAVTEIWAGSTAPTAAAIADAVCDEVINTGHSVPNSLAVALTDMWANSDLTYAALVADDGTVNDASATTTSFITTLTGVADDYYKDGILSFTNGTLASAVGRVVLSSNGTTGLITVSEAFTSAPANGVLLVISRLHQHPVTQIATGVRTELATELARIDAATSSRSSHTAANVRTEMDSNSTQLAAIVADTNELQTDWVNGGRLDVILDATATASALSSLVTTVGAAGAGLTEAGGTGDHLTAVPWNAAWDAEVQSEVTDALTTALTEAYRTAGATGSVAQLLYEISAHLGRAAIASTTKTLKKVDNSTTAQTYTLDDATTPTAVSGPN